MRLGGLFSAAELLNLRAVILRVMAIPSTPKIIAVKLKRVRELSRERAGRYNNALRSSVSESCLPSEWRK